MSRSLIGERYDLRTGPVAHGGHVVARLPDHVAEVGGTVVFVRHALPDEVVTVQVTEGAAGDRFLRGDAVAVHEPSPDRVEAPCRYAGPGCCGGCDFQHVALPAQRRLKEQVVAEQLRRLAGAERAIEVRPVPGDDAGLRWRTRMRYHRDEEGRLGLRRHRSSDVVPVDDCLIQAPGARVAVDGEPPAATVTETVRDRRFDVDAEGFWQAHVGAPDALVEAVLELAEIRAGDRVADLFCGVGLFSAFLADGTGPTGSLLAVEGDRSAAEHARSNLTDLPWVDVVRGPVDRVLRRSPGDRRDVVVLDPPRVGSRRAVVAGVAALRPRRVVLVSCDPAAFARDTGLFAEHGYALGPAWGLDLFPMTHHVEVVAAFSPG